MPGKNSNSDNFTASSSEVAVAAPPWITSESEDDEPVTHKLEVYIRGYNFYIFLYFFFIKSLCR